MYKTKKEIFMKKGILLSLAVLLMSFLPVTNVFAQSYSGTTISAESDGVTYKIVASAGDTVTLVDVGSGTGQIVLTFGTNVNGSMVIRESTTRPASAPTDPSGSVNFYYDVTLNGISNSDITAGKWRFSVTKDWLNSKDASSSNVFLQHYGSSWERLTTRETSSSSTSYSFEADVNDFSPFAVTAVKGLSNTGSPYMLGAVLAVSILAVVGGAFALSRKRA